MNQVFADPTITIVSSHYLEIANQLMINSPTAGLYSTLSNPQMLPARMAGTAQGPDVF